MSMFDEHEYSPKWCSNCGRYHNENEVQFYPVVTKGRVRYHQCQYCHDLKKQKKAEGQIRAIA